MRESPRDSDLSKLRRAQTPTATTHSRQYMHQETKHSSSFSCLTFHMIKIPSSTNKVKKRGRERGKEGGRQLSLALSLSSVGCRNCNVGGKNRSKQRSWEPVRMWILLRGCVITSHDMFPLLTVLSLSILTRQGERERERGKRVHRPLSIFPSFLMSIPPTLVLYSNLSEGCPALK